MTDRAVRVLPYTFNTTYVKVTNAYGTNWQGLLAADPSRRLTGGWADAGWFSTNASNKIHIQLGEACRATRIYIENSHDSGASTNTGVQAFTVWGSNTATDFTTLTYATMGTWEQLTTSPTSLAQHVASDVADPQYVEITNPKIYLYYALKVSSNWGGSGVGLRRIVYMAEPTPAVTLPYLSMRGRGRMR